MISLVPSQKSSNLNLPHSPPKLPILGNLHQIDALLHRRFQALSEKYGPVLLLYLGSIPTLIVSSAEVARDSMMNTRHYVFTERPQTRAARALFFGCRDIAFSPFGDYWRQAKIICVQELLSQRRVQAFKFVREEEVANMVLKIRLSSLSGATVDLTEMFAAISNIIISRYALGRVYEGDGYKNFAALSKTAMELTRAFCFEDLFPIIRWMCEEK
ncbi:hypothetical protein JRO89_XS13G0085600 [Xanthoceras sorbifolium]|uniref:Cytochrome P450 n=1 Tax=Xanthoceras sorbifolium TaxID=99658 RepID=A0ABQ8H7C3_9ROSI|nr:hypothetical protein JRO89_XS13G0085600 [Xanthoceras sorbifolium]